MAFFSSNYAYDSQLRRKRSTSTTRDRASRASTGDKSSDEASMRKRSPSVSASPSSAVTPEPHEPAPPLPTPVSAGDSRSRTATSSDSRNASVSLYDQSSTPIPFTKPIKRTSPPSLSNLMIDVPGQKAVIPKPATLPSPVTDNHPAESFISNNRTAVPSSSLRPITDPGDNAPTPPEGSPSEGHPSVVNKPDATGLALSSKKMYDIGHPPQSTSPQAMPPPDLPPSRSSKQNSPTAPVTLPTPISPPQNCCKVRHETILPHLPTPSKHSRSHSQSQVLSTSSSPSVSVFASGPGSANSSTRRVPVPLYDQDAATAASGSGSGNSTPPRSAVTGKQREKRARNVLRKPSTAGTGTQREPASAPTSDSEKRAQTHRPRARSVVLSSSRRNSTGAAFDLSQLLPARFTSSKGLTPAREILVAYKESQRETSFGNSGRVVAVGSPEDDDARALRSPWTSGWRDVRLIDEVSADERDAGDKRGTGLRRSLSRKLSGRWGHTKEVEKPRIEHARRVASGSAVEFPERRASRDVASKRSATYPNDSRAIASPTSGGDSGWPDEGEGRVWEEGVGDWIGTQSRGKEDTEVSNSKRLWKLVKRFSSGNLREKHSPPLEAPPPVPPLPKDIILKHADTSPGNKADIDEGEMPIPQSPVPETTGGIMRYITSVPSLSIPRQKAASEAKLTNAHRRRDLGNGASTSPPQSRTSVTHRSGTTGTMPQARRSTTTRSSSAGSETTRFFSRSRTSSSSSYGDALVPPIPNIPIAHTGKHGSSPGDSRDIHNENENTIESHVTKTSAPSSASSSRDISPTESATIPFFESQNCINRFSAYKGKHNANSSLPSTSHFPNEDPLPLLASHTEQPRRPQPPPIPQRNPRRAGHTTSAPSLPLPLQDHSMPGVIPVQGSFEPEVTAADTQHSRRKSDTRQTRAAFKARPRSISDGATVPEPEQHPSTAKSTLTFRELTTTQRQLTEQEKNAKWEDLLQRSDKAGGTLHVGSPTAGGLGLWSDRTSMAFSETLDSITD